MPIHGPQILITTPGVAREPPPKPQRRIAPQLDTTLKTPPGIQGPVINCAGGGDVEPVKDPEDGAGKILGRKRTNGMTARTSTPLLTCSDRPKVSKGIKEKAQKGSGRDSPQYQPGIRQPEYPTFVAPPLTPAG
jgi:hypothetical protein